MKFMLSRIPAFASSISSTFSPWERATCFWRANSYIFIILVQCNDIVLRSFYPLCKINNLSDKSFVIKLSLFNHIQNSVQSLGVFKPAVEALQGNVLFVIFIFISSFLEFASREETFDAENKRKNQFQFDKFSKDLYFIAPCPSCVVSSFTSEIVGRFICFLALLNLPLKIKCTPYYINAISRNWYHHQHFARLLLWMQSHYRHHPACLISSLWVSL